MSQQTLKLGTRGSALALAQADLTTTLLKAAHPDLTIERVIIKTTGDRRTDVPLSEVAKAEQAEKGAEKKIDGVWDKGVFIKELEVALENGKIDLAVHSLKDLPTIVEPQFALPVVLEREDTRDVLITKDGLSSKDLNKEHTIATSSVRRARQLQHLYPGIQICDLRGNVPTRLKKLATTTDYHGILLAAAGLNRLNYAIDGEMTISETTLLSSPLDPESFLPAAGQGAIALQTRVDDQRAIDLITPLNHQATFPRITAEREFLRLLSAGCHTPVGIHSLLKKDQLHLFASVYSEEDLNAPPKTSTCSGNATDPIGLAKQLHASL